MRNIMKKAAFGALLAGSVLAGMGQALAVDATDNKNANLNVKLEITPGCTIGFGTGSNGEQGTVDFGKFITLDNDLKADIDLNVRCSKATPAIAYTVSMSAGGANTFMPMRKMRNPAGQTIDYNIYSDANYATIWGTGANVVNGTTFSKGADKDTHKVWLKVPAQKDKALSAGVYTDTVTATVIYGA